MQGIIEGLFDVFYLTFTAIIGVRLIKQKPRLAFWYGVIALLLVGGDLFHLVPRVIGLLTVGLDELVFWTGLGKLITSITMSFFYFILFFLFERRYHLKNRYLEYFVLLLLVIRLVLLTMPNNHWFELSSDDIFGLIRNIPFILLGIMTLGLSFIGYSKYHHRNDLVITYSILFSFLFYIPVVLFAQTLPIIGILMIPKTICYMILIYTFYNEQLNTHKVKEE